MTMEPLKIGILEIGQDWIALKAIWGLLALMAFMYGWTTAAIGFVFIIFQATLHEFVHAAAAKLYGGDVYKITLTLIDSSIDFSAGSVITYRRVFLWGAVFDIMTVSLAAMCFVSTGQWFWILIGILIMPTMLYYMVIPPYSDFNLSRTYAP